MKTSTIEKNLAESELRGKQLLTAVDDATTNSTEKRTLLQAAQAEFEKAGEAITRGTAKPTTIDKPRRELDIARAGFDLANRQLAEAKQALSDHRANESVFRQSLIASQRQDFVAAYLRKIEETQAAAKVLFKAIGELYDLENQPVIDGLGFEKASNIRNRGYSVHLTPIRLACQALVMPIFEYNEYHDAGLRSTFQRLRNGGEEAALSEFGNAHRERLAAIFPKLYRLKGVDHAA